MVSENGDIMLTYNVKLDAFEGPLDLLLHLITKAEVDIYDIPLAKITDQYMEFIHAMQNLELDVASEFLVMAATLLAIKSKMLLPKHEDKLFDSDHEFIDEDDPREELINRLIEYKRYKEAAGVLKEKEQERGLIFSKAPSDLSPYVEEVKNEPQQINANIYDMINAFNLLLKRKGEKVPRPTKITREDFPIEKRMEEVIEQIRMARGKTSFFQLFQHEERSHLIVTFLAVLELMKAKKIICKQEYNFSDFYVYSWDGEMVVE